jgi:aspartate/methionine/tyrosine aminotransferase
MIALNVLPSATKHTGMLRWVRPQGGMTAFPWLARGGDTREFCRGLAGHGILIVPGDCFGEPSHFRLGFAASGEQFPRAIERFADYLESGLGLRATSAD